MKKDFRKDVIISGKQNLTSNRNLKISGSSSNSGGEFNNVTISGEAFINGDISCSSFKVMGTSEVKGNFKAGESKVMGTAYYKQNVKADRLKIMGTVEIAGNAEVKDLDVFGTVNVGGNLTSEKLGLYGEIKVGGDCSTELFMSKGPFNIGGLLNVGNTEIEIYSKCYAREIGGEQIHIKRGTEILLKRILKMFYMPTDFYRGHLTVDCIEGDDIYLEYTKAAVVRGSKVKIGPGCEIGLVEYGEEYDSVNEAIVKESKKV